MCGMKSSNFGLSFNSSGGGNEYFDWTGDVNVLNGDRTIYGGVRDIGRSGGEEVFSGKHHRAYAKRD